MKKNKIIPARDTSAMFREFSSENIPRVDECITSFIDKKIHHAAQPFMAEMYQVLREYIMRDGKRLRPLVLLLSYHGYGNKRTIPDSIIRMSSVLEIMHSFLLIQDDIIDRSPMRRGGKALHVITGERYGARTSNRLIGNDLALVMADVLFANCIEIISAVQMPSSIKDTYLSVFAGTYEMTAWGQILDSLNSQPMTLTPGSDASPLISKMKTAYYTLYYPMVMGYVLAGGIDRDEWQRIESFAFPAGIAFQIQDDVLGVFGDANRTGKPSDSDIMEEKLTLLIQETVDRLPEKDRSRFVKLFLGKKNASSVNRIRSIMVESGALDAVQSRQADLEVKSSEAIRSLGINRRGGLLLEGLLSTLTKREK